MEGANKNPERWLRTVLRWGSYSVLGWFSFLMLRITLEYLPVRDDAAFLQIKQQYIEIDHWRLAFSIHVFTSLFVLLAGFTQFAPAILRLNPPLHRWMGRLYVILIVLVTGPASLIMGFYANGGITSRIAFITLALLWMITTFQGWRYAMKGEWKVHQEWVIRSYALTLSAITLRIWKYLLVMAFEPRPMDVYRIVAWLGFVPNVILAEMIIHRIRNGGTKKSDTFK